MNERIKEIKWLLQGRIYIDDETGLIIPADSLLKQRSQGYHRGADFLRLFGMKEVAKQYHINANVKKVQLECVEKLLKFGNQAWIPASPDALVILRRHIFYGPVVIILDAVEKELLLTICTARSPFCRMNVNGILKKWESELPVGLKEVALSVQPPVVVDETEEKKQKKTKKKSKKEESDQKEE